MNQPCKPWPLPPRSEPSGVPAWVDPRLVMALTAFKTSEIFAVSFDPQVVAVADPKRVCVGFIPSLGHNGATHVTPVGSPVDGGWPFDFPGEPLWFDLLTFGALVTAEWRIGPGNPVHVQVVEIYRLSGG